MPGGTLDTTPQVTDPTNARSYAGPRRIRPDLDVVEEIAAAGDFEGVLTFGVGIDERAPFRVLRLSGPGRIVDRRGQELGTSRGSAPDARPDQHSMSQKRR